MVFQGNLRMNQLEILSNQENLLQTKKLIQIFDEKSKAKPLTKPIPKPRTMGKLNKNAINEAKIVNSGKLFN